MFHDADSPRSRPRANTSTFSPFGGWRKQKQDQSTTPPVTANPTPPPLQLEELIQALTPPAVPSLAYARSLATGLSTHSPIPRHAVLNPILATLCAGDSPVALQCAGFEILSAYFENPEAVGLGTSDRISYFYFFLDPATASWGTEIWEPRFKALRALTRSGTETLGIEIPVLTVLKTWISSAFDSIVMDLALERSDRAERERSVNILAEFLTAMVGNVEFVARIPEDELVGVLHFYASLVEKAMDISSLRRPSLSSPPIEFPPTSSPVRPFSQNHRRNPSSVSVTSSVSSPPVTPGAGTKQPSDIAIAIYINHLTTQLKTLSSTYLDLILPFLFRALTHCASALPRLTVTNQPSRTPSSESKINETLNSLLSGPYATTCMIILKRNLYPSFSFPRVHEDADGDPLPLNEKAINTSIQSAFGAQRTLRSYIRRALSARLARAYISRQTSAGYSHSGAPAHMEIEQALMERAWPSTDAGPGQSESWVAFSHSEGDEGESQVREGVERILDEIAGTLKDVLQEVDARDEDNASLSREEAAAVGQTLFHLAEYVLPLKNPDGTSFTLPLSRPSDAPTNFLRTLTFILARDHSLELKPLLSRILLHVAHHLADADTAKLPLVMAEQNDLTPISPEWLEHWETLLKNQSLVSPQRPLTRKAVMVALESVHDNIRDMPSYRRPLARLVLEACKRSGDCEGSGDDSEAMWKIVADEVVFITVEDDATDSITEYLDLLVVAASESNDYDDEDFDTASITTAGTHSPAPLSGLITPSTAASPILSRMQSEFHSSPTVKEKDKDSGLPYVMSSIISSLTSGTSSRSQSIHPVALDVRPEESGIPTPPEPQGLTSDVAAVSALIIVFSQLAFTPHALEPSNLEIAVRVFRLLLQLLEESRAARIRVTILQFLMRLRSDRDHRLYFVEADRRLTLDNHRNTNPPNSRRICARDRGSLTSEMVAVIEGAGGVTGGSSASRSRSRIDAAQPSTPASKPREPLWSIPESLPFTVVDVDTPSEGLALFDPVQQDNAVLPISLYLAAIHGILEKEHNWEVLSYVLCHLPNQLANKHLFCGPKSRTACSRLLTTLCTGILNGDLGSHVERWPTGLKARDAHGLAYHTLSVLVGYQPCFDMAQQHLLVEVFQNGLDGQPATIKCCLHALSLAAFEIAPSMTKCLSRILQKLSQIMSNADMAVHILGLLSIIGSSRPLYANFTEADFKMVFGVALQYLQHHHMNSDAPSESWALSEHVRILSYYIVSPDRRKHVPYITRQLLLANEGKKELDGPTEVCFDWLERYTFASADPRPTISPLADIVMNPTGPNAVSEEAIMEKTWALGNSLVTLRTLKRLGWFEVLSRRPSGYTKLLCRLENLPMVGPGDVEPDILSVPAALMMERGLSRLQIPPTEDDPSAPSTDQDPSAAPASNQSSTEDVREILATPDASDLDVPPPDPLTGYVWSGTAPSQRRKQVEFDPAHIALQLSDRQNPYMARHTLIESPNLPKFFTSLDRIPVIDTHKVGIMYVAPGQTTELEILRNTHGSPAYTRFLEGIGRLINLRGQVDVYAGGLDPDEDGEYAYAWWDDIGQILYHTATMMPSKPHDPQFTNKKRHIGNDFVRIVWNDSGKPYRFDTLNTQFQFVNIVIEPHSLGAIAAFSNNLHENEYFKLTVQRASDMPEFAPVGPFKLISAKNLPLLVRQLSLLADWFASVFAQTQRDTERQEITTNWHSRLDAIRRFRSQVEAAAAARGEPESNGGITNLEMYRDFTTAF
ncbi:Rap-GAP domain-containing protein [Mycena sanguinolenta]|uniref:Rap-GAP domain-containing protein n=1 Tax=Mycena sanguinolenta TaxID=230812 RepID=A0A8H7DCW7_9AGAR|nr:Rap-GAP domain-containing protein [Mycena sanguinolenta]